MSYCLPLCLLACSTFLPVNETEHTSENLTARTRFSQVSDSKRRQNALSEDILAIAVPEDWRQTSEKIMERTTNMEGLGDRLAKPIGKLWSFGIEALSMMFENVWNLRLEKVNALCVFPLWFWSLIFWSCGFSFLVSASIPIPSFSISLSVVQFTHIQLSSCAVQSPALHLSAGTSSIYPPIYVSYLSTYLAI